MPDGCALGTENKLPRHNPWAASMPAQLVDFMVAKMLNACQIRSEARMRCNPSIWPHDTMASWLDYANLYCKAAPSSIFMKDFKKLTLDDTFQFSCHPGIACFNRCCGDLNQFLTPYDILRLKQGLKVSSGEFLKRYTTHHIGPASGLPVVTLKMRQDENLPCPFLSKAGCTVYADRPGSCRTYPLARIVQRSPNQGAYEEFHVVIKESHCLGFDEPKTWTVREWKEGQEVEPYNEMNDLLMDIISAKNRSGVKRLRQHQNELFYLACYDLDRFRGYVFDKRLWENHAVDGRLLKAFEDDDVSLMRFGMEWIKEKLFKDFPADRENTERKKLGTGVVSHDLV